MKTFYNNSLNVKVLPILESYTENTTSNIMHLNSSDYAKILNGDVTKFKLSKFKSESAEQKEIDNLNKRLRKYKKCPETCKKYQNKLDEINSRKIYNVSELSFYEVLKQSDTVKLYFDIEKIPINDSDFIYNIINDLKDFIKEETGKTIDKYILTMNLHSSSHDGRSYHLIFPEQTIKMRNLKKLVILFLNKHEQYTEFIDIAVYSKTRLFKSVNQINIKQSGGKSDADDKHVIISDYKNIEDTIIQTKGMPSISQTFDISGIPIDLIKEISSGTHKTRRTIEIEEIKQTIKDELVILRNKRDTPEKSDDEILGTIIGVKMKKLNSTQMKFISELEKYYDEHKTFNDFRLNRICIWSILNTM